MNNKREYFVAWTSAATNTRQISTCPSRADAIKEARSLEHEGAKNVQCFSYCRNMRQSRNVNFRKEPQR